MNDYKVEMKPTYWEVVLSSGSYSDYSENHLFFAGNDEDEIWNFLCRYIESIAEENDYSGDVKKPLAIKFNDKKFISEKYKGDKEEIDWNYDIVDVSISRLNVIYFNK